MTDVSTHCRHADGGAPTLFDKIINKQIPANIMYEDDTALAFRWAAECDCYMAFLC